ncbi:MAG: CDGSH iron-sulfur domain-containing protein [Candidatus Nitrosopolaris sp.]
MFCFVIALVKMLRKKPKGYTKSNAQSKVHICMCGMSNNQSFCDGSHEKTTYEKE